MCGNEISGRGGGLRTGARNGFSGLGWPFILRGAALQGIDSVMAPKAERIVAWNRLASDLDAAKIAQITQEISLAEALEAGHDIVLGKIRGRVVVDVNR